MEFHNKETCSTRAPLNDWRLYLGKCSCRACPLFGISCELFCKLSVQHLPLYFFPPNTVSFQLLGVGVSTSKVLVMVVVVFALGPAAGAPFSTSLSLFAVLFATFVDGGGELSRTPVRRF